MYNEDDESVSLKSPKKYKKKKSLLRKIHKATARLSMPKSPVVVKHKNKSGLGKSKFNIEVERPLESVSGTSKNMFERQSRIYKNQIDEHIRQITSDDTFSVKRLHEKRNTLSTAPTTIMKVSLFLKL